MPPKIFDADQRATERAAAGLRLGGVDYPRRKRTNAVMAEVRKVEAEQRKINDDEAKARDAKTPNEARIAELGEQAGWKTFELIAILLDPPTTGDAVTAQDLADQLDITDAIALANHLSSVEDEAPEPDPS